MLPALTLLRRALPAAQLTFLCSANNLSFWLAGPAARSLILGPLGPCGDRFSRPTLIDETVLDTLVELIPLAPLHNPANIAGIKAAREDYRGVRSEVAMFELRGELKKAPAAVRSALEALRREAAHRVGR